MFFHGGGKPPPKKTSIEKLALTNNMAAVWIRTLLAVSVDGTLSNDPSPSQLLYIHAPAAVMYIMLWKMPKNENNNNNNSNNNKDTAVIIIEAVLLCLSQNTIREQSIIYYIRYIHFII